MKSQLTLIDRLRDHSNVEASAYGWAIYRFLLGIYSLCYTRHYYGWLADIPQDFFKPQIFNIVGIFEGFPSRVLLNIVDVIIILSLCFVTIGIRTRVASILYFALVILMNGFVYSIGKIDHGIFISLSILMLSFTNAGTELAVVKDKPIETSKQSTSLLLFSIALCFGLLTAGLPKLIRWIDFDLTTSGILRWYYSGYYSLGRTELMAPYFKYVPRWIIEIMDYIIPIFEVSGYFFLYKSKFHWRLWLFLLCIFHFSNTMILNIPFSQHVFVYGIFILPVIFQGFKSNKLKIIMILTTVMAGLNILLGRLFYERSSFIKLTEELYAGAVLWLLMIMLTIPYLLSLRRKTNHKHI